MPDNEKITPDTASADKLISSGATASQFAVVESYKMIRTNLLFLLSQTHEKAITISSSVAGEGKSTTAVNIAIAFSQLGSRVLLIDADMRKPSVHKKLRIPNNNGLSSLLVGFSDYDNTICPINSNFDVITAGPTPPNPSELLGSELMKQLLSRLGNMYDYIIIDTPPVNIVPDALVVAPNTSGIAFVVQDGITPHEQLQKAIKNIDFAGVKLLGVILNGSNNKRIKKYRYKYRYGINSGYQYGGYNKYR